MNSTKILFLKMLKGDIKRYASEKAGIDPKMLSDDNLELLAGQTIGLSNIESFSSYKLMNEDERSIVKSILDSMKVDTGSNEKGRALIKNIDSLVPHSEMQEVEFKDTA